MKFKQNPPLKTTVLGVTGEDAGNNDYLVTVVATELLAEGQDPPAKSSSLYVTVTVEDVDEDGSISLNRIQPRGWGSSYGNRLSDPDRGA